MGMAAAGQLLHQEGHCPRRRPICGDVGMEMGKDQMLLGLRACSPLLMGAPCVGTEPFSPISLGAAGWVEEQGAG